MNLALCNVNGQIVPASEAKVSVYDRSYIYGDSLYEVARTYRGHFFKLKEHLERLRASCTLCRMELTQSLDFLEEEVYRTYDAFLRMPGVSQTTEAYCRIILSRGVGKIGFGLNQLETPTLYTLMLQPADIPTRAQFEKGFHYKISERIRNHPDALSPAMKSGNYLNNLLAFLEARYPEFGLEGDPVYDDALLVNGDGHLTEGTTFNIFYVKNKRVITPPTDIGILHGITRKITLELCDQLRIPAHEVRFPASRLFEADEVFMTSSVKEVFPVTMIDKKRIADGKPGRLTLELNRAFQKVIDEAVQTHSRRRSIHAQGA